MRRNVGQLLLRKVKNCKVGSTEEAGMTDETTFNAGNAR